MNRLFVSLCALLALTACPSEEKAACGPESFEEELKGCNTASLAQLPDKGYFNLQLTYGPQNLQLASVLRFVPDGTSAVLGRGATSVQTPASSGRFYIATQAYTQAGDTVTYAFAGCESSQPAPTEQGEGRAGDGKNSLVRGAFKACTGDTVNVSGSWNAERIDRRLVAPGQYEADRQGLQLVSETRLDRGSAADVYVHTVNGVTYAFVPAFTEGLRIYKLNADRTGAQQLLLRIPADNDYWNAAWAKENTLFVASASKGVLVFDLSRLGDATPALPAITQPVANQADVHTLFMEPAGDILYAASPGPVGEVFIYKYDPAVTERITLQQRYLVQGSNRSNGDFPHDMFVLDGRLYVNHWAYGFTVSDLTQPGVPAFLGRDPTTRTSHASAVVKYPDGRTIAFEGGEDWGAHLRVLDVSDPANIKQLAEWKLRDAVSIHNMIWRDNKLYVAHYQDGVRVLDVTSPESPQQVAWYNTWRETDPNRGVSFYDGAIGMRVPGDGFIYVTDTSRGLLILREGQ